MFKVLKNFIVSVILSNSFSKLLPFTNIGLFFLLIFNESNFVAEQSTLNFLYSSIIKPTSLKLSGKFYLLLFFNN